MGLGLLVSSRFHDHTHLRHTTDGRTPLDEGSARRRDLYLTTHNTHKIQTSMPPVGFGPTILVSEQPKTHALDRTVTGIGKILVQYQLKIIGGIVFLTTPSTDEPRKFHVICTGK
jgi:hypothetical protein